jgi:hypothetical protein
VRIWPGEPGRWQVAVGGSFVAQGSHAHHHVTRSQISGDGAGAKADERQVLLAILAADPGLAALLPGQVLIGDKNYHGRDFEAALAAEGACLLRPARHGEPSGPAPSCSSRCARSSNRSTTPSKGSSTSNATAGTHLPA